jgi:hypothetical protein
VAAVLLGLVLALAHASVVRRAVLARAIGALETARTRTVHTLVLLNRPGILRRGSE